ncbi:phospho-N-acetylmuramoyl-pentapeptide-transferase [bacterium CPR1]|nr:phospho-N-acetylmuramoyl-pentapeptide-transferase [bacterium CPR1]
MLRLTPLALALLTGFGFPLVSMSFFIAWMRRLKFGQAIREEGPKSHFDKAGTPTMGGAVLVLGGFLGTLWSGFTPALALLWVLILGGAALGAKDDLAKVIKRHNAGLKPRHKLVLQLGLGLLAGLYLVFVAKETRLVIPGWGSIDSALLIVLLSVLVVTATTNAVNLTDGLDGLAGGTVSASLLAYLCIALALGRPELAVSCAALIGACLGFLWFNCYPARIFMGDTGSMALGAALAGLALLTRTEFWLPVIGGVYVAETLSVMLQVSYFKLTKGKRIFRMSPLHHHFEATSPEMKVTVRFCIASVLLGAVGVLAFLGVR